MKDDVDIMQYFRDPEATRKAFRGGYFNTGDLAVMHPDGAVAVMDRSKDIIISGGEVRRLSKFHVIVDPHFCIHVECVQSCYRTRLPPTWFVRNRD